MTPEEKTLIAEFEKRNNNCEFGYLFPSTPILQGTILEKFKDFLLSTHRTAREEGRREGLEELKKEIVDRRKMWEPAYDEGEKEVVGIFKEVAALIDARIK